MWGKQKGGIALLTRENIMIVLRADMLEGSANEVMHVDLRNT